MTPAACPTTLTLQRLGHDSIAPGVYAHLEEHIAGCERCQSRLERLALADPSGATGSGAGGRCGPPEIPGFAIGAELGRGGGGVVYEAVQLGIGRRVALKVLDGRPGLDRQARRDWLREAQAIGRIRHPHVVRLHQAGEHDGCLYLVLDLIPGGSLKDRMSGPLVPRAAAGLVETVARAVAAIHAQGLRHLDIKPSNILIDGPPGADWPGWVPVLTDFGIALDEAPGGGEATASSCLGPRGTPAFMAPEQVSGRRDTIGPAADVFALGATLYALLTGRPPFQAASALETLDLLRTSDPAPPRALVPGIPRDLETICLNALRKDPGRRYATATALADDLRRWRDGFPIRARPISPAGRTLRWGRRHPLPAALAATILASLISVTHLWQRAESQRDRAEAALTRALQGEAAADDSAARLLALISTVVDSPQQHLADRLDDLVAALLEWQGRLRHHPGVAAAQAPTLAGLQIRLAASLQARNDPGRARMVLLDALELLRVAARARPDDPRPAIASAEILLSLGMLANAQSQLEEAAALGQQAVAVLDRFEGHPATTGPLVLLHGHWRGLAEAEAHRGDPATADRILARSARYFERLRRRLPPDPTLDLLAMLSGAGSPSHRSAGPDRVHLLLGRLKTLGDDLPTPLIMHLGELIVIELCGQGQPDGPGPPPDPERFAAMLRETIGRIGGSQSGKRLRAAVVEQLGEQASVQAIRARHRGRLDQARGTIAWMMALGQTLVAQDPGDAWAHMLLSKAHQQRYKLAWHLGDHPSLEPTLHAALLEATAALERLPSEAIIRVHTAALREKYVSLRTLDLTAGPPVAATAGGVGERRPTAP